MKITLELEAIQHALDVIARTAPPPSGNITFTTAANRLTVVSVADLSRCTVVVPAEVDGDGEFAVSLQAVKDAVKGRNKITIVYANAAMTIQSGSYKADLSTMDVIPYGDDQDSGEEANQWKLSAEQADWLRKSLKDVALKPTTILSSWMPSGIRLTDKGAFVVCYDTQHMSWVTTKKITGNLDCVLPIDVMQSIAEVFHKSNFTISQSKTFIKVRNKTVSVVLNIPSTDDIPTLAQVQSKIKEASAIKSATLECLKADLLGFMDNARAVVSKERAELEIKAGKGKIELFIKTVQGQMRSNIKGRGETSIKVDFEYFQELVSKAPDQITMNVVEDAFISVKLANSNAIVALNQ
jgi:hypothetical protein